jgi:HSP20 family molecular chaperone IbpA
MNEIAYYNELDPFDMFRRLEALLDFDTKKATSSNGLKRLITRPHNLITRKDDKGNITSFEIQLVYTPFNKSDVKVEVKNNVLTIRCGETNKIKDADMVYCGISHQSSSYSLPLDESIDTTKITAKADDGMLYVTLPVKLKEEAETLSIEVK